MKLLNEEKIIKVYHHHLFFFISRSVKLWIASLPFLLLAFIFGPILSAQTKLIIYLSIFIIFGFINFYDLLMYYLDSLIITTQRIVHLDWINPFRYTETEAMLYDIQDIETEERGFLSKITFFDFGNFIIETASTRTTISFTEAPDPEGIKFFVTNISRKHNTLRENIFRSDERINDRAFVINNNRVDVNQQNVK